MNEPAYSSAARPARRIIVLANEKGGSGKSTTAMHIIVALLRNGKRVGSIDLDARQGTLSRYVENRNGFAAKRGRSLPMPTHRTIEAGSATQTEARHQDEADRLDAAIAELAAANDFIVIDTPGSDTFLARQAHTYADTLITPINDSFVDFDVLAKVDADSMKILAPSHYAVMVWDQRKARAARGAPAIDWIVVRNRLASLESRNQRAMERMVEMLAKRIGFRVAPGISERVIFRELFLAGLTLLDMRDPEADVKMTMSHIAARQEIFGLLDTVGLDLSAAKAGT